MSSALRQSSLDLGPESRDAGESDIKPTALDLPTTSCARCGSDVVLAHCASTGKSVELDAAVPAYLHIGEREDGTPLVVRPSNGLALHDCRGTSGFVQTDGAPIGCGPVPGIPGRFGQTVVRK